MPPPNFLATPPQLTPAVVRNFFWATLKILGVRRGDGGTDYEADENHLK